MFGALRRPRMFTASRLWRPNHLPGGGYEAPYTLKKIADYWFTQGVNRLVFHTSAEQPLDTKPGNTMVGTHINRNITWAEQAGPVMTYFARVSYMLQQGNPVADLAYLLPEGAPSTHAVLGRGAGSRSARGIRLRLHEYRCSAASHQRGRGWPHSCGRQQRHAGGHELPCAGTAATRARRRRMSCEKLHDSGCGKGATIMGQRPTSCSAGMKFDAVEYAALVADLWGDMDGVTDINMDSARA